jgi:hypothetical protein
VFIKSIVRRVWDRVLARSIQEVKHIFALMRECQYHAWASAELQCEEREGKANIPGRKSN